MKFCLIHNYLFKSSLFLWIKSDVFQLINLESISSLCIIFEHLLHLFLAQQNTSEGKEAGKFLKTCKKQRLSLCIKYLDQGCSLIRRNWKVVSMNCRSDEDTYNTLIVMYCKDCRPQEGLSLMQ